MIRRCECCGKEFTARSTDVKRGWAKFCSKSCKAIRQEQRSGANAAYRARQNADPSEPQSMSMSDLAGGGYGDATRHDAPGHDKW